MLTKPLTDWMWDDIGEFGRQRISETTHLEFKRQRIESNLEIARDVAAIANAGGGHIILGIPEIDGVAQPPIPLAEGEHEANRIVQVVLSGVSPPLRAITTRVISGTGGNAIVVRVPRSRAPAMVHLERRTEFWVRRDRQRVPMSHEEIVAMVRDVAVEVRERDEFLRGRLEMFGMRSGGSVSMMMSTTPTTLQADLVPVRDGAVHAVMKDDSRKHDTLVWGVRPEPSLDGLEGGIDNAYRFEVHLSGHIEIWHVNVESLLRMERSERLAHHVPLEGIIIARTALEFDRRVRKVLELSGFFEPFILTFAVANARNTMLPRSVIRFEETTVIADAPGRPWPETTLVIRVPYFPDESAGLAAKRLCDRIWQAYGHWDCTLIDDRGRLAR